MSHVNVVGYLSGDPELRYTTGGKAVTSFRIGEKRGRGDDAKWTNFNVQAWNDLAENVSASLTKGDHVVVVGSLQEEEYENSEGQKRHRTVLVAHDIAPSLRFATCVVERNERKNR